MIFQRIDRTAHYVSRRIKVPDEIRRWALGEQAKDTRPLGQYALISDIYLALVEVALPDKASIKYGQRLVPDTAKGMVMQFPPSTYKAIEDLALKIRNGEYENHNEDVVRYWVDSVECSRKRLVTKRDIFICLLEHGFQKFTKPVKAAKADT